MTFNKIDFYCMTDTDEMIVPDQMDATSMHKVWEEAREEFSHLGPYRIYTTPNGWTVENSQTHINPEDGHVYTVKSKNQFNDPSERKKAISQDFTPTDALTGGENTNAAAADPNQQN